MMKMRLLAILLPLLMAAGIAATLPEVAHGATDAPHMHDGCVSYPEFQHAPYGPKRSVDRYMGAGKGERTDKVYDYNPHFFAREYPACVEGDWLVILYRTNTRQAIDFYYWVSDGRTSERVLRG